MRADLVASIGRVKAALGAVLDAVPGDAIRRASEVRDTLGIENRLAWKIWKVTAEPDPVQAARHLPGTAGLQIFLRAARGAGTATDVLSQASEVLTHHEEMVKEHAGDRPTFESMLVGQLTGARAQADLTQRRSAFRPISSLLGVSARAYVSAFILAPSETPGLVDAVTIRGYERLRWLRPDAPWRLTRMRFADRHRKTITDQFQREPLDPRCEQVPGNTAGIPLLVDFCSTPQPRYQIDEDPETGTAFVLAEGQVGNHGAITCFMGEPIRDTWPRYSRDGDRESGFILNVSTPSEFMVLDLLVPEELYGPIEPQAQAFTNLFVDGVRVKHRDADRLPFFEEVEHLGLGPDLARLPEVPRYKEMLHLAFDRTGWDRERFGVFRLHVGYPMLGTSIRVSHPLPEERSS